MSLDWTIFCRSTTGNAQLAGCLGQNGELSYLQWLLSAWGWTATVALLSFLVALVIGIVIGTLRTWQAHPWLSGIAAAWVELFRDIPLLVQVFLWYHVAPFFLPVLKSLPSWLLVSIALGLFTSARIAEQVRAGIQSLPRGQRDAARALGMREVQVYRRVILPVALRIMIPALTSEAMSIVKNSSVAFVVAVAELTQFAMQAQEETARGIEIYLAVTLLYALTAFGVNRILAVVESRVRVPGIGAPARARSVTVALDLTFFSWDLIGRYVLGGLWFSLQLTVVASIGGVLLGTLLAMMRISGNPVLMWPAAIYVNTMRSVPLVMVILWFFLLMPFVVGRPIGAELSAMITFIAFEAAFFCEIVRSGIQAIPRGQLQAGTALGLSYAQNMRLVVLPQAIKNMLPVLLTQVIVLFQDTSLVYAIGAYDLLKGFDVAGKILGRPIEAYIGAALVYFVICLTLSRLTARLQARS